MIAFYTAVAHITRTFSIIGEACAWAVGITVLVYCVASASGIYAENRA